MRKDVFVVRLAALVAVLVTFAAVLATAPSARAEGPVVRGVSVSPGKILADGGQADVRVSVSGVPSGGSQVTLSTTLGAFGAASGPKRVVLPLALDALDGAGAAAASAALFGDGRRGTAAVTARIGDSVRTATVVMAGAPQSVEFPSPAAAAVLSAETAVRVVVELRDGSGVTVPETSVVLTASSGVWLSGTASSATRTLVTDVDGRVRASLRGDPGAVTVTASSGEVSGAVTFTLHGPTVSLQLVALRDFVAADSDAQAVAPGTLVAILLDDGGRPVVNRLVQFETDRAGVRVDHTEAGESALTDSSGRAPGHVSATGAAPGPVRVTASADGLSAFVTIRVVGLPAQMAVGVTHLADGSFRLVALVRDAAGQQVLDGPGVTWGVSGLPEGVDATFDPQRSTVRNGIGQTVLRVLGDGVELSIRATLQSGSALLVRTVSLASATEEPGGGTPLQSGLTIVVWTGSAGPVAEIIEPVLPVLVAAWRLDAVTGWQAFFPSADIGQNFSVESGDLLYLVLSEAVSLAGVDRVR